MTVKLPMDPRKMRDGTILVFGISYPRSVRIYSYALMKMNGQWYASGSGRVPQAAGWGAVERWLDSDGRKVEHVRMATGMTDIWPPHEEPSASPVAT
jgi:hypothetical protein